MHILTIHNSVLENYPWVAVNVFEAFEQAKDAAVERALKMSHAVAPVPWGAEAAREMQGLFGDDIWPYGLEPNRATIEAFLRFGHAQGVAHRKLTPEELFAPQTLDRAVT